MLTNEHLTRQLDLIPVKVLGERITIIGAGAIGGWTALALAKMGFEDITVIDFDEVSVENMNSQFYRFKDIGAAKVFSLQELVKEFTGIDISVVKDKYEAGAFNGIVISAVDNMAVRKTIWENHKNAVGTRAVIDPRMGAEEALIYVMKPFDEKDEKAYEHVLYSDDNAVAERCTAKATIYTANMLSGLVCKAVKDLLTRNDYLRTAQWNIRENQFIAHKAG